MTTTAEVIRQLADEAGSDTSISRRSRLIIASWLDARAQKEEG